MPKTVQPDYLTFTCPLTIEAAGAEKSAPSFSMVAYSGGLMRITGFPHPVVVDLEGLGVERQDIPVRLDHNPRQGVGHTSRVAVENGQVLAEGLVSRDTSWARDVAISSRNGFPWQASIGAAVIDAEFIPNGQSVMVNGRTFTAPLHVVRRAVLKEISLSEGQGHFPAPSGWPLRGPALSRNQATTPCSVRPLSVSPEKRQSPQLASC